MRVGIDITPLQVRYPGGIGTSTYEIVRALAALPGLDIVLYGTRPPMVPFTGRPLDIDLPVHLGRGPLARSNIAWLRFGAASLLRRDGIDVFWGTRNVVPRGTPDIGRVASVYDFWHLSHPEQQPRLNRMLNAYSIRTTARDADVLAAISEATADDARRLFPAAAAKVRAVPLGVDAARFGHTTADERHAVLERLGIATPYILAIDVYNPRKNFERVLRAAATTPSAPTIVGLGAPRSTAAEVDVEGLAASLGLRDRLVLPGDVSTADLEALYYGAEVFVYPSVYEGFGMPVLEAMAAGVPVLTSNTSSLPEVAGDAAFTIDPTDDVAFARALDRLLLDRDLREKLKVAGRARALEFTWERTARGLLSAFEDADAMRRGPGRRH